jgi:hypothetical protein
MVSSMLLNMEKGAEGSQALGKSVPLNFLLVSGESES